MERKAAFLSESLATSTLERLLTSVRYHVPRELQQITSLVDCSSKRIWWELQQISQSHTLLGVGNKTKQMLHS